MSAHLISIIGPPASGKTTLAELLAEALPAGLIREDYLGNPFLAASYTGPAESRLPAQLWYLLSRVNQLASAGWPARGVFVSDYGFCQDRLYALQRLRSPEVAAYEPVHAELSRLVRRPDVLVRLDAAPAALLERIRRRGRRFERVMDAAFLDSMRKAYDEVLSGVGCPVVAIRTDKADVREAGVLHGVVSAVRGHLGA
jgi:deoxyadenosine/deoxycytidine kinase